MLTVKRLTPGTIKKVVAVKGKVQSYRDVTVTSQVSGEILRLHCKEGDEVKKDQLLAEIDPKTLVEDLATTYSRMEQAKLALTGLKIRNQESQEQLGRAEPLFSQGLLPEEEIQKVRYAAALSANELERAAWQIKEMEGIVASFEKKLNQTKILAPISGVVTKVIIKEGEGVIQGLVNTNGTAILRISDMTQKGVTVWVSEAEVPYLKPGLSASVTSPNFRGRTFKARVDQIALTGQPEQQTELTKFEVKTLFTEFYPELLLEMSAAMTIEVGKREQVLKLPLAAIQTEEKRPSEEEWEKLNEGKDKRRRRHQRPEDDITANTYQDFVYVVEKTGKLAKRSIATGMVNDQEAEIAEGLERENLVVIGPAKALAKLEAGKEVKWEEEKPASLKPEGIVPSEVAPAGESQVEDAPR